MLDSLRNLGKSEHRWVEESLSAYIDGELSAKETARVEKHLQECRACAQNLATLRQTVILLKELPAVSAPRSFTVRPATVRSKVRAAPPGWGYGLLKGATALAALLLIVLISGDLALHMVGGIRLAAPAPMAPAAEVALAPSEVATITPVEAADEWMAGEGETTETATVETPAANVEEAPPPAAETAAPEAYRAPSAEGTATPVSEGLGDAEAAGTPTSAATPAEQEAEQIGAGHAATPVPTVEGTEPISSVTPLAAPAEQKTEYAEPAASPPPRSTPEAVAAAEVPGEEAEARDRAGLWAQTALLSPVRLAELVVSAILLFLVPATLVTGWLIRRQGP